MIQAPSLESLIRGILELGRILRLEPDARLAHGLGVGIAIAIFGGNVWAQLDADAAADVRWYIGYRDVSDAAQHLIQILEPRDLVDAHSIVYPFAFHLSELGDANPWVWQYRGEDRGTVYLLESEDRQSRVRAKTLRKLGFGEPDAVRVLDRSRILRFQRD